MSNILDKLLMLLILLINSIKLTFAALDPDQLIGTIDVGTPTSTDPLTIVKNAINWGIGLIALVAVVFLIMAGVKYITAEGDSKKIEEAQHGITNSIIGLVICFLAVAIVNFVLLTVSGF